MSNFKDVQSYLELLPEYDRTLILSKRRRLREVNRRHAFILNMLDLGFSFSEIGRALKKHHSTILMYAKRKERAF